MRLEYFSRRNEASASSDQQYVAGGMRAPFYHLIDKEHMIRRTARAAGASVGALTGMAVGSRICPGVGTVIGGVVGGVLGAAGGSKIASKCLR